MPHQVLGMVSMDSTLIQGHRFVGAASLLQYPGSLNPSGNITGVSGALIPGDRLLLPASVLQDLGYF